jgi:hypothetical protein
MSATPSGSTGDARSTSAGNAVYLDLVNSAIGWQFHLSGATYLSGWRPTRKWAKRAGRRRMRAITQRR